MTYRQLICQITSLWCLYLVLFKSIVCRFGHAAIKYNEGKSLTQGSYLRSICSTSDTPISFAVRPTIVTVILLFA